MDKLRFAIFFILFGCISPCAIHSKSYDASQLPIVVRNVPEWSNKYLTVINDWEGMFVRSVQGELPPVLSVIASINGKDATGMNEEDFNTTLMSQGKSTIEYLIKRGGENIRKQCTIQYHSSIYWAEGVTMENPEAFPGGIEIHNIKNADTFSFNTFSYQVGKLSEVDEIAVLEAAGKSLTKLGFAKTDNCDNSDMVLSLSKSRDNYNGYKITLNVLDGKILRKGQERVLWALEVLDLRENLKSQESTIKTSINKMCNNFPFDQPTYSQSIYTLGVAFESEQAVSTGRVLEVLKGSDAYEKGLRGGDAIMGAYAGYSMDHILLTRTRCYYFKPNRRNRQKNWGVNLFLIFPIIPKFNFNNADHYLTEYADVGGNWSKNHFKVRSSHGQQMTMNAPFEKRTFHFKYIR